MTELDAKLWETVINERNLVRRYVAACERIRDCRPEEFSQRVDEALALSRRVRETFR